MNFVKSKLYTMYGCHNANKTSPYRTPTMVQNLQDPGLNLFKGEWEKYSGEDEYLPGPYYSSFNAKSSISHSCQWCQHLLKILHTITENWDCLNNLENHNQNCEKTTQLSKPVSATLHQCSFTNGQVTALSCNLTPHFKSHNINIFKN